MNKICLFRAQSVAGCSGCKSYFMSVSGTPTLECSLCIDYRYKLTHRETRQKLVNLPVPVPGPALAPPPASVAEV